MPEIDLDAVRADTPGVAEVLHFNNAGAALPPAPVVDAVVEHLRLEARIGGYEAAARAAPAVERVYAAAAELIGANRDEIASWRTPPGPGRWPSTASTSGPATGS